MSVSDDIEPSAEWIASALTASGYVADFTAQSAWEIDRFFDEQMKKPGKPQKSGLLSSDLGPRLFAVGAYVGELIRRNGTGWVWADADDNPEDEINVRLMRGTSDCVWPIQRVMKRYGEGPDSAIAPYVALIADIDIGTRPAAPKRRR